MIVEWINIYTNVKFIFEESRVTIEEYIIEWNKNSFHYNTKALLDMNIYTQW